MKIEFYKVCLPDRLYGYYAGYSLRDVRIRAYSDINDSVALTFEPIDRSLIPENENIERSGLNFDDARSLN